MVVLTTYHNAKVLKDWVHNGMHYVMHGAMHHVMHHVMHPVMNHVMHHVLPRCTLAVLRLLLGSPELRAVRAAAAAAELTRPSFARLARGATHTIA